MGQGFQTDYSIDICFVIDSTGSMGPIINQVKANALQLHNEIKAGMDGANKRVNPLRIRVIDFADFATEFDDALHASAFFELPGQEDAFKSCVDSIDIGESIGGKGGDIPENALEALWLAMNSDWCAIPAGKKGRHIIVLITDAPPLALRERSGSVGYYDDDYPENIQKMGEVWAEEDAAQGGNKSTKLSKRNKRLILFAPDNNGWDDVIGWEDVLYTPVDAGTGLIEFNMGDIVEEIVRSTAY